MNKQKIITGLVLISILVAPVMILAESTAPRGQIADIESLVETIENFVWIIFGLIAVISFVVAGILFLTAAGNPEKVAQARTAFLWGVAGVVVGILAFSIVAIIQNAVT